MEGEIRLMTEKMSETDKLTVTSQHQTSPTRKSNAVTLQVNYLGAGGVRNNVVAETAEPVTMTTRRAGLKPAGGSVSKLKIRWTPKADRR